MDMNLFIACIAVAFFGGGVCGYVLGHAEAKPEPDVHSGPEDVEKRARRAF